MISFNDKILPPCFRAHMNGSNQTGIADITDTQLTFGTEAFDVGDYFTNSVWTPPAGLVLLGANIRGTCTQASGQYSQLSIKKNSSTAVVFGENKSFTNVITQHAISVDVANGTDSYSVWLYNDVSSGTTSVDGTPETTYFFGVWLGP